MTHEEYIEKKRCEAIAVVQGILLGAIDPIDGIRKLNQLRVNFEQISAFDCFVGMDSETDDFPRGEIRKRYEKLFLERLDEEARLYLDERKDIIKDACKTLVEALDKPLY
jgi:hypothetical protein